MRRLPGLDRLRAAALLLMLFHHFTGWFHPGEARRILPGWEGFGDCLTCGSMRHVATEEERRRKARGVAPAPRASGVDLR